MSVSSENPDIDGHSIRWRRLDKVRAEFVRAEFSLTVLAYNPRRALNIPGVEKMMEAVRA